MSWRRLHDLFQARLRHMNPILGPAALLSKPSGTPPDQMKTRCKSWPCLTTG